MVLERVCFCFGILFCELVIFLCFGETNFQVCGFKKDSVLLDEGRTILQRLFSGIFLSYYLLELVFAN